MAAVRIVGGFDTPQTRPDIDYRPVVAARPGPQTRIFVAQQQRRMHRDHASGGAR
jgi:hypothetical protein